MLESRRFTRSGPAADPAAGPASEPDHDAKIRQSQANLDNMMQKGGADAALAGRLLVEIQDLQGGMLKALDSFSAQGANTLTIDQKTKLKTLQDALALMPCDPSTYRVRHPGTSAGPSRTWRGGPIQGRTDREDTCRRRWLTEFNGSFPAASGRNPRGRVAPKRSSGRHG